MTDVIGQLLGVWRIEVEIRYVIGIGIALKKSVEISPKKTKEREITIDYTV